MVLKLFRLTIFLFIVSSCMEQQNLSTLKVENPFEKKPATAPTRVLVPQVQIDSKNPPYVGGTGPKIKVATGAEKINCETLTHFAISEDPIRPSDSEFIHTCESPLEQVLSHDLVDTTEGQRFIFVWAVHRDFDKYSSAISLMFNYDTTAPTGSVTSLPAIVKGGTTETITFSGADNIALDELQVEYTTDGTNWIDVGTYANTVTSTNITFPVVDTASAQARVHISDMAGNITTKTTPAFTLDSTGPASSIVNLPSVVQGSASQNITFSSSDISGVPNWELQYSSDGSTFSTIAVNPTSPYAWSTPALETSNGVIKLVATDGLGNQSTTLSNTFVIDSTPPSVGLDPVPSLLRGGATTTITYSATDASSIASMLLEYAADGTTYSSVASVTGTSYTWTIPTDNTSAAKLRFTATDIAGNSNSIISNTFTVDSTNPTVNLSDIAAVIKGGATTSVNFTAGDTNGISSIVLNYAANGTTFSLLANNPTSPYSWVVPSVDTTGSKLQLIVTDNAGNVTTVENTAFNIDSTPPTLGITNLPSPLQGGASQNITFTNSDANGVASLLLEYSLDGINYTTISASPSSPQSWTIPTTDTVNADIRLTGTDTVGNTTTFTSNTFTLDSTPPTVDITDLAAAILGGGTTSVTFSASDSTGITNLELQYAADGTTFSTLAASTSSPYSWSVPAVDTTGSTLKIIATDGVGNTAEHITTGFNIDSTGPTVTLDDLAAVIKGNAATNVTFSASDTNGLGTATLKYAADGTTFSTTIATDPTSVYSWSVPNVNTTGSKLEYSVTDAVGNTTTVTNNTFNIDITPPTISITNLPTPLSGGASQNITFTNSDTNGVASLLLEYSLDGINYTTISAAPVSPQSWTVPSTDSTNARIRLTATDTAGNVATTESNIFTVDQTPPATDITDLASVIKGGTTVSVTFSGSDATGSVTHDLLYAADGINYVTLQSSATSTYSWSVPVSDTTGSTLRVVTTDESGKISTHTTTPFNIDSTAPALTLSDMAAVIRGGVSNNVTHTKSDANGVASTELLYAADGINFVSVTANPTTTYGWSTPASDLNTAKLKLTAVDIVGNTSEVTNSVFEIDSTAPTGSISTPPSRVLGGSTYNITFSTSDPNGVASIAIQYAADGTNFSSTLSTSNTGSYSWTLPTTDTVGSKIRLVTTDSVGNQTTYESGLFDIDSTPSPPPSLSLTSPVYTNSTGVTFTAGGCGDVAAILINEGTQPTMGDASWQTCTTAANAISYTMGAVEGPHTLKAWSKDSVGNVSPTSTDFTVFYDVTAPVISITNPGLLKGGVSSPINWTVTETYIDNSKSFTLEYWDGFNWNTIGTTPLTSGPHTAQAFSSSWTVPMLDRSDIKFRISTTDLAGNSGSSESTAFTIDSSAPTITIDFREAYEANIAQDFKWRMSEKHPGNPAGDFTVRFFNGATWTTLPSVNSGLGPISDQEYSVNFDPGAATPNAIFEVSFTDELGWSTTVQKNLVIDGTKPTLSFFRLNNGVALSENNNLVAEFNAADAESNVTYYCFKYDDSTAPTTISDPCFVTLSSGLRAQNINITPPDNIYYRVGFLAATYTVYGWVADAAGNISTNSNTDGVDKDTVTYQPGSSPQLSGVTVANSNTPANPIGAADLTFSLASDIYLKWNAYDAEGLEANPIDVYYTTDDVNWNLMSSGISNSQGAGCTIDVSQTGCIVLSGAVPTTNYFKIRLVATDTSGAETFITTVPLNESAFKLIAGNTEKGVGGSSRSIVYKTRYSIHESDLYSLVVTDKGDIFVLDAQAGLLWVNPDNNVVDVLIPITGTASGDGGPISSATFRSVNAITLDYNNGLLIWDDGYIRRIDMSASPWTISAHIGNPAAPSNPITPTVDPNSIRFDGHNNKRGTFTVLPNGDIYLDSGSSSDRYWRHYDASENLVKLIEAQGQGIYNEPTYDWTGRGSYNLTVAFNPLSSALEHMHMVINKPVVGNTHYRAVRLDYGNGSPTTPYQAIAPYDVYTGYRSIYVTGMDGNIYANWNLRRDILKYDHTNNTYVAVAGTGGSSALPCADGTPATSCPLYIEGTFVNPQGQLFLIDHGLVRTIDDSGNMVTLSGQFPSSGTGIDATSSRISNSYDINFGKTNAQMDTIILGDYLSTKYREFTIGGNINDVTTGYGSSNYNVSVDPATGDILSGDGAGVNRYNRLTDTWSRVIGGGATWYYDPASDGLDGNQVRFDWYTTQVLGISPSGDIMVNKSRWNGTTSSHAYVKLYDSSNNYVQTHFAGQDDTNRGSFLAAGTPIADSRAPLYGGMVNSHYDATRGWIFKQSNSNRLMAATVGGNIVDVAYLPDTIYGFAYRIKNGDEVIYYCRSTGYMAEYNITTATRTDYTWGAAGLKCNHGQRRILYRAPTNSIIFLVNQNGLTGVAEYKLP